MFNIADFIKQIDSRKHCSKVYIQHEPHPNSMRLLQTLIYFYSLAFVLLKKA